MEKRILECVPNFSEGRDKQIIKQITDEIERVEGVKLLDVDPGSATNRTVVTFAGEPEAVVEAAFRAIRKAGELIDMQKHHGAHPRMGATDVCPLVPVSGITIEEAAVYARQLGKRVGEELGIPVYLYEHAACRPERKNLSVIRSGEYERLEAKMKDPAWQPDFGKPVFNARSGATVIGARDFLVAYNVNLNTTSVKRANAVAFDIRENGRIKMANGKKVLDDLGDPVRIPGSLKYVKAIGWYIEEYGIAQVSINLTNINQTPVHIAFDECCRRAEARGMRVTGSELVGMIPLQCLLTAGKYFLEKQQRSAGVSETELLKIAVKSLGLDDLAPFDPQKKVIEYVLEDGPTNPLREMSLQAFAEETASESPAPGGGSVSAYAGALGASLGTMVANLSAAKTGWEDRWNEFSQWAETGQRLSQELLQLVDEDTRAFARLMDAYALPKSTDVEKQARKAAIQTAVLGAAHVPLRTMRTACDAFALIKAMVEKGNPNSISDSGVAALCTRTAAYGAYLNVRINIGTLQDTQLAEQCRKEAEDLLQKALAAEEEILEIVNNKL